MNTSQHIINLPRDTEMSDNHQEQAEQTIAQLHELFEQLKEAERNAELSIGTRENAKAVPAKYEHFYKTKIIESSNPIIRKLYES